MIQSLTDWTVLLNKDKGLVTHLTISERRVNIELADGVITVKSIKENSSEEEILHRGISYRKFEKRFSIADDIQVKGAKLENGLLTIDLERIVPEEKKPRTIAIK